MPAKICPRCGNLYEDIHSKTCPNCFAVMETIDRETAQEVARGRAHAEQSPEFQALKAAEDERWREQSFRACLSVVGIFLATAVFAAIVLLVAARHHRRSPPGTAAVLRPAQDTESALPPLPAENAAIEAVMPAQVGPFDRAARDQDTTLPGTTVPIFHGVYVAHTDLLRTADVFAIPQDRPPTQQEEFADAIALAARLEKQAQPPRSLLTRHWRYAILGNAAEGLTAALEAQFQGG